MKRVVTLFMLLSVLSVSSLSFALSVEEEQELGQIILELEQINNEQREILLQQEITIQNQNDSIDNLEKDVIEQERSFKEQKKSWVYKTAGYSIATAIIGFIIGALCL